MNAQEFLENYVSDTRKLGEMFKPKRIYIAGPISHGDMEDNVRLGIQAGETLLRAGYAPFVPQLSYYWNLQTEGTSGADDYSKWLRLDFEYIKICDGMLRLPGYSSGAMAEVKFADLLSIPVFYSVGELRAYFETDYGNLLPITAANDIVLKNCVWLNAVS